MRVPHATPQVGNDGWEYTFFFSLYEHIDFFVTYVTYSFHLSNCFQWKHMNSVT